MLAGDGLNTPNRVSVLDGGHALVGRTVAMLSKTHILRCSRHLQVLCTIYPTPPDPVAAARTHRLSQLSQCPSDPPTPGLTSIYAAQCFSLFLLRRRWCARAFRIRIDSSSMLWLFSPRDTKTRLRTCTSNVSSTTPAHQLMRMPKQRRPPTPLHPRPTQQTISTGELAADSSRTSRRSSYVNHSSQTASIATARTPTTTPRSSI